MTTSTSTKREIPSDFPAGWQNVRSGKVEDGDIVCHKGYRDYASASVGSEIRQDGTAWSGLRVYRRIPTPKQTVDNPQTTAKARTNDDGKPPLACLPWKALREVAMVQLYGERKYGDFDNYRKGMEIRRNASCAMRHIADFIDGNDLDPESMRSHLAHAACRLLFILENMADRTAIDDRYNKIQTFP